jgi:hypothetical protein
LVWADDDTDQNGFTNQLHASFRLSQDGEVIALLAPNGQVVDSVSFGEQRTDISEGRSPDGQSAPYIAFSSPTPARPNAGTVGPTPVEGISAELHGGAVTLVWPSQVGRTYRIQFKTNLNDLVWQPLGVDVVATGPAASITDSIVLTAPQRYYRVLLIN